MEEDKEDVMTPIVDALSGGMCVLFLTSIVLIVDAMNEVTASSRIFDNYTLHDYSQMPDDNISNIQPSPGEKDPPIIDLSKNRIFFFNHYELSKAQKEELTILFQNNPINSITMHSDDDVDLMTKHTLAFLKEVELIKKLDDIQLYFLPSNNKTTTMLVWEFK